jgi:hypothetical protein
MTPKAQERLNDLVDKLTQAHEANPSAAATIMADAARHAWRIIQRADVPADMERAELVQTNGPIVEFSGSLVRREEYHRAFDDKVFAAELWMTKGGNWVAVWESDGHVSAKRVDAGDVMTAMDFWQWGSVARTLAKKLRWGLRVEIE